MRNSILFSIVSAMLLMSCSQKPSNPDFSRQLQWWEEARYGMFVHWGISTVEGFEISWPRENFGPERYDSLALRFNPAGFDANAWIDAAEKAGMKYIVLTTKHHDGFCLWDTKTTEHNIMNTRYGKDVLKQLADAAHERGMRLGWYWSIRQWDDANCSNADPELNALYIEKMKTQLKEILTNYGKIDLLWFDYEGHPCPVQPQVIFDYVRGIDPDIIMNNRLYPLTSHESSCYVGSCGMYATPEQVAGAYGEIPWETCSTSSGSRQWSIRYNDSPRPAEDLIWETLSSAGGNGNMLMNVGPDSLGIIPPTYIDRLAEVGDWFRSHEDILYGTHCGPWKPTGSYVSTARGKDAYLVLKEGADITLPYANSIKVNSASIDGKEIGFTESKSSITFDIPDGYAGKPLVAIKLSLAKPVKTPLDPFSTSGSLAYKKPVKASTAMSFEYMHSPQSIVDDFGNTVWYPGRRHSIEETDAYGKMVNCHDPRNGEFFMDHATLEVDLGGRKDVSSFEVQLESAHNFGKLRLEYKEHGQWKEVASVSSPDGDWKGAFDTVNARRWRLVAEDLKWLCGIREFQLFE